jgi:hypothetical protein
MVVATLACVKEVARIRDRVATKVSGFDSSPRDGGPMEKIRRLD